MVFRCATADVSLSGVRITCAPDSGVMPGDGIHLVFPSDLPDDTVEVAGRIVWRYARNPEPGKPAEPWRLGVRLYPEFQPGAIRLLNG
jgi:hypothetical protein